METTRLTGDYTDEITFASRSALLELSICLKAYRDSLVVVGGWAPYLIIEEFGKAFTHVGSIDIDIAVDPENTDDSQYASILSLIEKRGYRQRTSHGQPIHFSYQKDVPDPNGDDVTISIDFLTSIDHDRKNHRHATLQPEFRARMAEGCGLAFHHHFHKDLVGILPGNGEARSTIKVLDIAGCIGMKGIVLGERYKEKDAYDIYSVVTSCLSSPEDVGREVARYITEEEMTRGIDVIRERFRNPRAEGPSWVASFIHGSDPESHERKAVEVFVVMQRFLDAIDNAR